MVTAKRAKVLLDLVDLLKRLSLAISSKLFGVSPAIAADGPTWLAARPEFSVNNQLFVGRKEVERRFRDSARNQILWDTVERQVNGLMSKPGLGQSGLFRLPIG